MRVKILKLTVLNGLCNGGVAGFGSKLSTKKDVGYG